MQTIENSFLQASVAENGAQITDLVLKNAQFDYFKDNNAQQKITIAFPAISSEKDWAALLPWTVVDKGDTHVSLTLIDTKESYQVFPYHFEVVITYELEGNQLKVGFFLRNNSHKEMPFSLTAIVPIIAGWTSSGEINGVTLTKKKDYQLKLASVDFALAVKDKSVIAAADNLTLAADSNQRFTLTLMLS
ncbi:aldose epimerase [Lactobacillus sp. ESL0791]|uniref:aldose epimerase family protein n=1 Tax=Lactobacillus sp. ESL0791 TaxID=2983234 RepID=UPI0023F792E4|nr:aldose epimerase [Lactobacillus sp. ESL0791]MDF7638047.1 aldose epimerase [Lactobacillus sp. ESL0791]